MRQVTKSAARVRPTRFDGIRQGRARQSREQQDRTRQGGTWILGTLTGLVLLAGCTSASDTMSAGPMNDAVAAGSTAAAAAPSGAAGYESGGDSGGGSSGSAADKKAGGTATRGVTGVAEIADAPDGRQVIRTASVTVEIGRARTEDRAADDTGLAAAVAEAAVKVRALAGAEGYVASSESSGSVASISLRVPASSYESVMKALRGVGTVTSSEEKAQDVSAKLVDVGSRIETMKASVTRVRALLARAEKISDVVALESELEQRESDLDSLLRQQSALSGQVALSTITVVVQGRLTGVLVAGDTEPEQRSGFLAGLHQGWNAFTDFLGGAGQVIGALLPFLPLIAILGLAAYWLIRRGRRRGQLGAERTPPTGPNAPSAA